MARRKHSLPPVPKEVHTLLGPVRVKLVKRVDTSDSLGRCYPESRTIRIKKTLDRKVQHQVLRHEWLHLVFFDVGLHKSFDALPNGDDLEEAINDAVATALVNEMLAKASPQSTMDTTE